MKEEFTKFQIISTLIMLFLVPTSIFSAGIIILFQTNFSKVGILMSILPFFLGVASFFALNLHEVIKEINSKCKTNK